MTEEDFVARFGFRRLGYTISLQGIHLDAIFYPFDIYLVSLSQPRILLKKQTTYTTLLRYISQR